MAFDGNGNFIRLHNWTSDAANVIDISASEMDAEDNGFAGGLSNCITRDGQGKPNADLLPATDNTYNLGSALSRWKTINGIPVASFGAATRQSIGGLINPVTAAETAAGVVPTDLGYPAYDVRRYGAVGDGVTDDSAAFNVAGTIGIPIFVPDPLVSFLLNSTIAGLFQSFAYPKTSGAGTITIRNLSASDQDFMETVVAALEAGTATRIATFGDSTMWGANPASLGTQVATPPYLELQNFVNAFLGNSACTVVNYAISGTTLAQMLAGTDGSGLTFAARVAAEAAPVIYCNHGVNDAFGANQTTAAVYRAGLIAFVRIVRIAGKTPVLVTPHPCLTIGGFGSQARAENTARFANIMRSVAQQHGVILVDNNLILAKLIQADNDFNQVNLNLPLNVLADGVHGPQATYTITGNNLADAILGAQIPTLTRAQSRIGASTAVCEATSQAISTSTVSRFGAVITTGNTGTQTMRICFRIGETGLDLSYHHYIFSGGAAVIAVNLDGQGAGATTFPAGVTNLSQFQTNFGSTFLQDVETQLIRNIGIGLHLLTLTATGGGGVSFTGLRVRNTEKPVILGATAQDLGYRQLLSPKFALPAGAVSVLATTDIVCSRFIDSLELEWTAQMAKNSGLTICASSGTNAGANTPQQLLIFGLNGAGFAALSECTGPAAFTTTAYDAADHSGGSHLYRVIVTSAAPGTAQMFVDDVSVGTIALTQPYYGGWLGAWKNLNTDVINFTNISRVWRY